MHIPDNIRAFLAEPRFAVVATINPDGTPQQTILWYNVDGDDILLNVSATRYKLRNLRRDPRISLCFEDGYTYATLTGKAQIIEDQAIVQEDCRRMAIRYVGEEEGNRQWQEIYSKVERVTIRIPVESIKTYGALSDGEE